MELHETEEIMSKETEFDFLRCFLFFFETYLGLVDVEEEEWLGVT